jgi:hypothetical protein
VGKDGMVVVQVYRYIAPTALPFSNSLLTHGHRIALTMGYEYGAPLVLSATE